MATTKTQKCNIVDLIHVERIDVTIDEADFVGGVFGPEIDEEAYNDACNELVQSHVREALRTSYPNAEISVETEHRGSNVVRVIVGDVGRWEAEREVESEIESLMGKIGKRVLWGDLAPNPEDFKVAEDEAERAADDEACA